MQSLSTETMPTSSNLVMTLLSNSSSTWRAWESMVFLPSFIPSTVLEVCQSHSRDYALSTVAPTCLTHQLTKFCLMSKVRFAALDLENKQPKHLSSSVILPTSKISKRLGQLAELSAPFASWTTRFLTRTMCRVFRLFCRRSSSTETLVSLAHALTRRRYLHHNGVSCPRSLRKGFVHRDCISDCGNCKPSG